MVPVGAAENVDAPKRDAEVPPNGFAVFVLPKRPPVLVLVPKFPKVVGLACPKALL